MKRFFTTILFLLCGLFFLLPANAEEGGLPQEEYNQFLEGIPEDVAKLLPEELFLADAGKVAQSAEEISGFSFLASRALSLVGAELDGAVRLFGHLVGILLIAAVGGVIRGAVGSEALSRAVGLCTTCAVVGSLLTLTGDAVEAATGFFDRLTALIAGMIPLMGTLYAMGGNVGTAVVANGGMMIFLGVVEQLCAATLAPVAGVCVSIATADAFFGEGGLRGLGNFVKKVYTYFLGTVMLLLTFSLSVQTNLSAGADGLAMRSAKMLAGRVIPVVGSAVGETLRTVAGSVTYLKSTVGTVGIVAVVLLLLPPLVTVVLYRLGLIAASACADLLGCGTEGKLLEAFVTVYGYLLAVMCICAVSAVFLLTLFVKCGVALA